MTMFLRRLPDHAATLLAVLALFVTVPASSYAVNFTAMLFTIDTHNGETADVFINGSKVGVTPYVLSIEQITMLHFREVDPNLLKLDESDVSFTAAGEDGLEVKTWLKSADPSKGATDYRFVFQVSEGDNKTLSRLFVRVVDSEGNTIPCKQGKLQPQGPDLVQLWLFGV